MREGGALALQFRLHAPGKPFEGFHRSQRMMRHGAHKPQRIEPHADGLGRFVRRKVRQQVRILQQPDRLAVGGIGLVRCMVTGDTVEDVTGEVPAVEQLRAEHGVVEAEQLLLGDVLRERRSATELKAGAVAIGKEGRHHELADVVQQAGGEQITRQRADEQIGMAKQTGGGGDVEAVAPEGFDVKPGRGGKLDEVAAQREVVEQRQCLVEAEHDQSLADACDASPHAVDGRVPQQASGEERIGLNGVGKLRTDAFDRLAQRCSSSRCAPQRRH